MAKQTFTTGQVLTAAQMTSLQQTAMLGGSASAKTASYTLVAADAGTAITMSNASATTITVNTALFAAGDTVTITNLGAGVCTITAGTATVNSAASLALAQYESGVLDFTSTSAAIFVKFAGAAPAASGGLTLLSTTTLSGASTVVSSISQSYKTLYVYAYGFTNDTANGVFRIATNGSTKAYLSGTYGATATDVADVDYITNNKTYTRTASFSTFTAIINFYTESVRNKPVQIVGYTDSSSNMGGMIQSAGTFAVNELTFTNSGGNWSAGTVKIYGA
jgi:hypothetical protein